MASQVTVLGAGMVGVSIASYLAARGHEVILVDRKAPGRETSFGNAGLIQREAVEPHPFPRDIGTLWRVLPNRSTDIRYRSGAMLTNASALSRYWYHSSDSEFARIVPEYASLIRHCTAEHQRMIEAADADALIRRDGWLQLFRTEQALVQEQTKAEDFERRFGVTWAGLDSASLARMEPALKAELAGAIHWTNTWSVVDPGGLVQAYADYFRAQGGLIEATDAEAIKQEGDGWRLDTSAGAIESSALVLATGPWSQEWLALLGYRIPLFVMRGYHMHYAAPADKTLRYGVMDFENGYLVTPKQAGLRLTTGAELNTLGAPPRYGQLEAAEAKARTLVELGARNDATPWMGARPCLPDMKPVIGPAPNHANLYFAFGHGHQGFTLGPVTGRMLAEMMAGEAPFIDATPFRADRF